MSKPSSLSYTSPYLTSYNSPLIASPLHLMKSPDHEDFKLPNFNEIGLYELEKILYTYQIEYETPISEKDRLMLIKKCEKFFENLENINFETIRSERSKERNNYRNTHTFVSQNDVMLMADNQLVLLEDGADVYALDRYRDVDRFLDNERNLFNGNPLTEEQLLCLNRALRDDRYPLIEVDDLEQEVFNLRDLLNKDPAQKRYMEHLINIAKKYDLPCEHIQSFVNDLNNQQYNDFLKHYSLRQKVVEHGAIDYIIHKMNVLKSKDFIKEIIWAIDDFMFMIINGLTYDKLKEIRNPHYKPYDSEIKVVVDGLETYHVDLNQQKIGKYERRNNEGKVVETGMFKDDLKHGLFEYYYANYNQKGYYCRGNKVGKWTLYYKNGVIARCGYYHNNIPYGVWSFYDSNGKLIKEGSYVNGKKNGIWTTEKRQYYMDGVLLNYIL